MQTDLSWKEAIDKVLAASSTPLHYNEITQRIISAGYRKSLGATPAATVNAMIASSIKHDGEDSPYIRVCKGTFTLRGPNPPKTPAEIEESEDSEEQYDIITSFGMFWRRDAVEWSATPKLLGMQQLGATPVDFCRQLGIYLLYDGREAIYVGRTSDRPLGRRLYEHTLDRMSARWDRFSWFGLLPVTESGKLGDMPSTYTATKLIPALEAILIEALEPRQNRKRGDDLAAAEYLQAIDPEIEKRKVKATLDRALNKL
jgi:hypothetical protein